MFLSIHSIFYSVVYALGEGLKNFYSTIQGVFLMNQVHTLNSPAPENSMRHPQKDLSSIFIALLLIQLTTLLFFCFQKQDFHIDEIYSYILSNSSSLPGMAVSESIWNNWTGSRPFTELLTVQPEEQFSYADVYNYNSLDAHPPLFYFLLHTICSFFPNSFSKWFGLGINIVLFILTQLTLFSLSKKIFANSLWAIVPCAFFGGTQICFDSFTFIRMYSLLALLTVLLLSLHYEMLHREKQSDFLCCFVITFLGTFSHYYFAITAFFIAASLCFYLLFQKKWKKLFLYAISMLSAVLCVFLLYPAAVSQITGSSTNNVGNAIWGHMLDFSSLFRSCLTMSKLFLRGIGSGLWNCKKITSFVIVIFVCLSLLLKKNHYQQTDSSTQSIQLLIVGSIIFFLDFLTVTHISNEFINDRYIYNIIPLFALCVALGTKLLVEKLPANQQVLTLGIVTVWLISSISLAYHKNNTYLYQDVHQTNATVIEHCKTKPLVMVCSSRYDVHMLAGNYTILTNCEQMYITDASGPNQIVDILSSTDCSNGVVFMVITDQYWTNGFDGDKMMSDYIAASPELSKYHFLTYCNFGVVYLAE